MSHDEVLRHDTEHVLAVLHRSHERLAGLVAGLTPSQLRRPSYHSWTLAQVASHLGSGAEIFGLRLAAGLAGHPEPVPESFPEIWGAWDAKNPEDQARDAVVADRRFLQQVDSLTDEQRRRFEVDLFGAWVDLTGLLTDRLAEHAIHSWDMIVALDPVARIAEDAVPFLLQHLEEVVPSSTRYQGQRVAVDVRLNGPTRRACLDLAPDGSRLTFTDDPAATHDAALTLPAEAFVRLVYGRLDAAHTPAGVATESIELDRLRATFQGL